MGDLFFREPKVSEEKDTVKTAEIEAENKKNDIENLNHGITFVNKTEEVTEGNAILTEKDMARKENSGSGNVKSGVKSESRSVYSHEEAFEESCRYFKGDELAARVWTNKYALKDSFGNLYEKTPDDMHRRLAREIHRIEMKYLNPLPEELIYDLLKEFK